MNLPKTVLLAGAGAFALAGLAQAQVPDSRVMSIRLPDGQVEQIRYTGDVAPDVVLLPQAPAAPQMMAGDPFALLRRISAMMDAQAAAMMQAMAMQPLAMQPLAGAGGFGPVAVAAGPGVCMRSVQVTYTGHGAPHVVARTAGDCGGAPGQGAAHAVAIPGRPLPSRPAARTYEARNTAPRVYADNLIRPVGDLSR